MSRRSSSHSDVSGFRPDGVSLNIQGTRHSVGYTADGGEVHKSNKLGCSLAPQKNSRVFEALPTSLRKSKSLTPPRHKNQSWEHGNGCQNIPMSQQRDGALMGLQTPAVMDSLRQSPRRANMYGRRNSVQGVVGNRLDTPDLTRRESRQGIPVSNEPVFHPIVKLQQQSHAQTHAQTQARQPRERSAERPHSQQDTRSNLRQVEPGWNGVAERVKNFRRHGTELDMPSEPSVAGSPSGLQHSHFNDRQSSNSDSMKNYYSSNELGTGSGGDRTSFASVSSSDNLDAGYPRGSVNINCADMEGGCGEVGARLGYGDGAADLREEDTPARPRRNSLIGFVRPPMMSEKAYLNRLKLEEFNRQTDVHRVQMVQKQQKHIAKKEIKVKELSESEKLAREERRQEREAKRDKIAEEIEQCKEVVLKQRQEWAEAVRETDTEYTQTTWEVKNKEMLTDAHLKYLQTLKDGEANYNRKLRESSQIQEEEIDRLVKFINRPIPSDMSRFAHAAQIGSIKIKIMFHMDEVKRLTREQHQLFKVQQARQKNIDESKSEIADVHDKLQALSLKMQGVKELLDNREINPEEQRLNALVKAQEDIEKENRAIKLREDREEFERARREYLKAKQEALATGEEAYEEFKQTYGKQFKFTLQDFQYTHPTQEDVQKDAVKVAMQYERRRRNLDQEMRAIDAEHEEKKEKQKRLMRKESLKRKIQGMEEAQRAIQNMIGQVNYSHNQDIDSALVPMEIDMMVLRSKIGNRKKELSMIATPTNQVGSSRSSRGSISMFDPAFLAPDPAASNTLQHPKLPKNSPPLDIHDRVPQNAQPQTNSTTKASSPSGQLISSTSPSTRALTSPSLRSYTSPSVIASSRSPHLNDNLDVARMF